MNGLWKHGMLWVLALTLLVAGFGARAEPETGAVDAAAAFAQLKALAGGWVATGPEDHGQAPHEYRVASAGTVVMETMFGGTDHEMINMYHLDGEDLVLTHYCAGGNQPRLKLASATASELRFDFAGGTNLDPEKDEHIHSASIVLVDPDNVESHWTGYQGGRETHTITLALARAPDEK